MVIRRKRRVGNGTERGATLFVVVLAMTLLTGIGLYTVHSSALLTRAAGNEREALQTEYLAELGTLAMLSELATAPDSYLRLANSGQMPCRMNQGYDTTRFGPPPCLVKFDGDGKWTSAATLVAADSFGTAKDPTTNAYVVNGRFDAEMTDIAPVLGTLPGMDATNPKSGKYSQAKLTITAILQPAGLTTACVQNVMQVAGQHLTRAHILIGPSFN